jgi:hypothetical protein
MDELILKLKNKGFRTFKELFEADPEFVEEFKKLCKGEDGQTPTTEELLFLIEPLIPKVENGKDYVLTEQDKEDIASMAAIMAMMDITLPEKVIERTEVIRETPIVTEIVKEVAIADTPDKIIEKIHTSELLIKKEKIEGLEDSLSKLHETWTETETRLGDALNRARNIGGGNTEVYLNGNKVGTGTGLNFTGSGVGSITHDGHRATIDFSGGGGSWGSITGTLSDQTDLQDALDDKISIDGSSTTTASIPFAEGISIADSEYIYIGGTTSANSKGRIYNDSTSVISEALAGATNGVNEKIRGGTAPQDGQGGMGGMVYLRGGAGDTSDLIGPNGFVSTGESLTSFTASNNLGASFAGNGRNDLAVDGNFYTTGHLIVSAGVGTGGKLPATNYALIGTGQTAQIIGLDRKNSGGTDTGVNLTVHAGWATSGSSNKDGGDLIAQSGKVTGSGTSKFHTEVYGGQTTGSTDGTATRTSTHNHNKIENLVQAGAPQATLTSSSASIAWNLATNQSAVHTATEDTTLANPTNMVAGFTYIFIWKQHASSPKTLAFGNAYKWPGGAVPAVTATNNAVDIFTFVSDGTSMFGVAQNSFS